MKRVLSALVFVAASVAVAAAAQDAGMDASTMDATTTDMSADVAMDASTGDTAMDAMDATSMDAAADMMDASMPPDVAADMMTPDMMTPPDMSMPEDMATTPPDMATMRPDFGKPIVEGPLGQLRFSGSVTAQFAATAGGVQVEVESDEVYRRRFTDLRGRFLFPQLPRGTYDVTLTLDGYETVQDEVAVDGNVSRDYVMFAPGEGRVRFEIRFDGRPPPAVEAAVGGLRGRIPAEGNHVVRVDGDVAIWDLELGVSTWTFGATAIGYQDTGFTFDVPPEEFDRPDVQTYPILMRSTATKEESRGCACATLNHTSGAIPWLICLTFGFIGIRNRRSVT